MLRLIREKIVVFQQRNVTGQTNDCETGICCFSAKHASLRSRAKTDWLGIKIMSLSEETCLPADCCFSELALCKSN